ncbi:cysteine-rich receptor-like protein kinase 10 [Iris pallida]|uniref:Cysteine-rich receptor-like protein kinase 10 n=1 Tax=Iris pallida TaxID=29817 RepID=A0AAX6EIQ1_IRIPA|nr:cysteine-rich receptor-like protein kinase 10 [Iris pallida]
MALPRSLLLLLLLFVAALLLPPKTTAEKPLVQKCEGGSYAANSEFQSNLKLLLASLSASNSSFSTGVAGSSDKAYGLVMCRGDVDPDACKACVQAASENVTQLCAQSKQAIVMYDSCQLRYSDTRFFFSSSDGWLLQMWNVDNHTDPETSTAAAKELMGKVADRAARNVSSPLLFADGTIKTRSDLPAIYGLAQCTSDLSSGICRHCLQKILDDFWNSTYATKKGGRMLGYSCNFRFESNAFFAGDPIISLDATASAASPSPSPTPVLSPPPPPVSGPVSGNKKDIGKVLTIVIPSAVGLALIITLCICLLRRRSSKSIVLRSGIADIEDMASAEFLVCDLSMLKAATNNFSDSNKLGQGGFGAVYKGTLLDGEEIAVKRLSASSKQGIGELKNELLLVAKLQHKNLVRLRGVCLEQEEKLLVYEYVPNRSLDTFLFDPVKRDQLDWQRRFNIIGGIARGLRYLHEESHLRVIHRDLKASNVLLDSDMNPKISDFGLARLFAVDETQCTTSRVVGTFGYMAPEYAMRGRFSVKLDVFSFGVLLVEIVTGRKNHHPSEAENAQDLLSYTWEHWRDGTALEIVDPSLRDNFPRDEALRCIQIGLLCVQDVPANRPSMSSVVLMLYSPSVPLQAPLQPILAGSGASTHSSSVSTRRSGSGSGDRSQVSRVANSDNDVSTSRADPM